MAAAAEGQYLVGAMALAVAGGCLGFLPYNFHPARIFLGDTGSLFLGFLLSVLFIKIGLVGYPLITRAAVPVLIVGVALFDTSLVIWSRWRAGRPVFRGGTDHTSHRLDALLGSPHRVALMTYAAAVVTGTAPRCCCSPTRRGPPGSRWPRPRRRALSSSFAWSASSNASSSSAWEASRRFVARSFPRPSPFPGSTPLGARHEHTQSDRSA